MPKEQLSVEMTLQRRFNLGNFSHKEYTIKISGTEEVMEQQLAEKKAKLNAYLQTLDELIETAHEANMKKDKIEEKKEE